MKFYIFRIPTSPLASVFRFWFCWSWPCVSLDYLWNCFALKQAAVCRFEFTCTKTVNNATTQAIQISQSELWQANQISKLKCCKLCTYTIQCALWGLTSWWWWDGERKGEKGHGGKAICSVSGWAIRCGRCTYKRGRIVEREEVLPGGIHASIHGWWNWIHRNHLELWYGIKRRYTSAYTFA